ncbi:MAG TPA: serine/threonine-protein kinase [Gemmatimonadales bacterium]|nr:serine/threonine-protein kinase [Gemmatimonadales bacterium]
MPPADPQSPRTALGPYTLETRLGQGGFAAVWAARRNDGKSFAIKVLKPRYAGDENFEKRFRQESEVAARLSHPNVIHIEEVGRGDGAVYFVMDLYPGSLAGLLERSPVLPEPQLIEIATEVAEALRFAHGAGIVHRDIKPDNILLADDGRAVVCDFGIARAVSGYVSATGVNMTIGTPHYLSPEQAQGRPLDGRSDIYSLGITLYRAATGDLPFKSRDWYELARMHVEVPPTPPRELRPDLSRRLERIILRCLAKHPDDRYPSAAELVDDLTAIHSKTRSTESFEVPRPYLDALRGGPKKPDDEKPKKWWKPWQ